MFKLELQSQSFERLVTNEDVEFFDENYIESIEFIDKLIDDYIFVFNATLHVDNTTSKGIFAQDEPIILPLCTPQDYYCNLINYIYDDLNKSNNEFFKDLKERVDLKFNITLL